MWKSFFILLFSLNLLFSNTIDKGDKLFASGNYTGAAEFYKEALKDGNKKARIKLIMTYIKLGDNYLGIRRFLKSEEYYLLAKDLGSRLADSKLSKLYENIGDLYKKGRKYNKAYLSYKKAYKLGNKGVKPKLNEIKLILKHYEELDDDTRKVVDSSSPVWTKAIGRLVIPTKYEVTRSGYKISQQKCSATLVNFSDIPSSRVIVTASHCLTRYDKDAGILRFLIKDTKGEVILKYAKIFDDSFFDEKNTDNSSDYAILILSSAINKERVKPLLIPNASFLDIKKSKNYSYGSMAGYSSDIGKHGFQLTYDPKCELGYFNKYYGKSTCNAFSGASGGPVVLSAGSSDRDLEYYFVGVISHYRDDDFKNLYFSPHHLFLKSLANAVRKYNLKQ